MAEKDESGYIVRLALFLDDNGPCPRASDYGLAIAQYKYLHEPEFHAYVEYCVQERLRAIAPRPS